MILKAERLKLVIAKNFKYRDKYTQNKSTDQCTKCQDFKHFFSKDKRNIKCKIFADSHFIKDYSYFI